MLFSLLERIKDSWLNSRPKTKVESGVQIGATEQEGLQMEKGCVTASVCPSACSMGPLGDPGHKASLQHPLPPDYCAI